MKGYVGLYAQLLEQDTHLTSSSVRPLFTLTIIFLLICNFVGLFVKMVHAYFESDYVHAGSCRCVGFFCSQHCQLVQLGCLIR